MIKKNLIIGYVAVIIIITLHITNSPAVLSTNSWQVTHTQSFETYANSNEETTENILKIVGNDENIPEECQRRSFGIICSQETKIKVDVENIWTITEAASIHSPVLAPEEFATSYPGIQETNTLTNESSEEDKLVAQRILYERGLLSVPPTGFLGHLTKIGITYLQDIKQIYDEPDHIGPKTINELNALKERMEEENYIEKNPLPSLNPINLSPVLQSVYQNHASKINLIQNNPGFYETTQMQNSVDSTPVPFINYSGEIKILSQE